MKSRTTAERVAAWNEQYPVGTSVEYSAPTTGDRRVGRTRSRAVERDGLAFVLVEGCDQLVQIGMVLPIELGPADASIVEQMAETVGASIDEDWNTRLELDTLSAFVLLGALQLVLRHPLLNGEAERILRGMAVQLQRALPRELGELADLGWDPNFDAMVEPLSERDGGRSGLVMEA